MKTKVNKDVLKKVAIGGAAIGLVLGIISAIPILNIILCCFCFLIPLIGVGAGYYTAKEHNAVQEEITDALLLGGMGGAIAGICYGIVTSVIGGIVMVLYEVLDVAISQDTSGAGVLAAGAGSLIGLCIYPVIYTIVFAIGGAIGAAIAAYTNKTVVSTPKAV